MSRFAAAWLALREPADAAARAPGTPSDGLARRFAAALPRPARMVDLGAGTGANARVLAPVIGGDQAWWLVESDPALRAAQAASFAAWAGRFGTTARAADGAIAVAAAHGLWQFRGLALDLGADWERLAAVPADGVTCAAFLDLASAAWVDRLADWLAAAKLPFLAALTVDGRRQWTPPAPEDEAVAAAFRRHQGRDKGLGPAQNAAAAAAIAGRLRARGFTVATAASDWRLGGSDAALIAALVAGEAAAATEAAPQQAAAVAAWRARRLVQAAGTLAVTIGHCDMLALPP